MAGVESAVKEALGPAVDAAVQSSLAPAVGAAVTAAVEGAARAAAAAAAGGPAMDPEQLSAALQLAMAPVVEQLKEVVQAVRSTEGQLVKVVQDSAAKAATELKAQMRDAHTEQYNVAVQAYNTTRLEQGRGPLLPRKRHDGALPPSGLFPESMDDLKRLVSWDSYGYALREEDVERNQRIVRLLRFYGVTVGGKPYPATDGLPQSYNEVPTEFRARASVLRSILKLAA